MIKRAVRCCRRCGVAGGERVPPAPLGWYLEKKHLIKLLYCWKLYIYLNSCVIQAWDKLFEDKVIWRVSNYAWGVKIVPKLVTIYGMLWTLCNESLLSPWPDIWLVQLEAIVHAQYTGQHHTHSIATLLGPTLGKHDKACPAWSERIVF